VDETGRICREMKVPSHPDDLAEVLHNPAWSYWGIWVTEAIRRRGDLGSR
jgi:hypothetical protein